MVSLNNSAGRGEAEVSESKLILNREGRISILREDEKDALTICPKHRRQLTTDWPGRKNYICCYPAYQRLKKQLILSLDVFMQKYPQKYLLSSRRLCLSGQVSEDFSLYI